MSTLHKLIPFLLLFFAGSATLDARERVNFDDDWLFCLADSASMSAPGYQDGSWRRLNLPHDWSIESDFLVSAPAGSGGGALPGGVGWYRKHFTCQKETGKRYYIQFDGVYQNSTVYLNGKALGTRPYGFISFEYELTDLLIDGENVLAVRVDNGQQPNCRWYSGSGIYRHVHLLTTSNVHVAQWGSFVRSKLSGDGKTAEMSIDIEVENATSATKIEHEVQDASGRTVVTTKKSCVSEKDGKRVYASSVTLKHPELWSVTRPYRYKVFTKVYEGKELVDAYETLTGIRQFEFNADQGFSLNGERMKINGVCMHHDLGCLGAAVNDDALRRQLRSLKEMGCNAIRMTHNPPAPELLDMCDEMGFIVMDEAFDMWHKKKTKYDYSMYFDQWFERDLTDFIRRDRNHPSIFVWSTGNEVLEQWSSGEGEDLTIEQANLILNFGHDASTLSTGDEKSTNTLLAERLAELVRSLDPTRPITAGCNEPNPNNHLFKGNAVDIIGYNYHNQNVKDVPKNFPGKPFLFTESNSAIQTRGYYVFPSDEEIVAPKEWWMPYTDPSFMCSAYDNCRVSWGNHHEETWDLIKHNDFVAGQFIWTGWDYIGEPTPYGFPARSSYFGIVDLAGFPKDSYYFYQSEWTDKDVLHLFPHWNWIKGQLVDLWCYYNHADEVELYVNGRSQGVKRKESDHQYHVMWRVAFEPGEVKVVARKNGAEVGAKTIRTAGAPHHVRLTSDRSSMPADGKSLTFVTVEVVDKDGNLCPNAENQLYFELEGDATIAGVDNGSQTSMERFKANHRKAFFGKCLVVVQSGKRAETVTLHVRSADLEESSVQLTTD